MSWGRCLQTARMVTCRCLGLSPPTVEFASLVESLSLTMNGSLPPEIGVKRPKTLSRSPQIPCQVFRSRRVCRERRKQAESWTHHMSFSVANFDKSTILSAGNGGAQPEAFGTGEPRKAHVTHLLEWELLAGKRRDSSRRAGLPCFPAM